MGLSIDLISQFAKVTNDKKEEKNEKTVYGTVVKQGDEYYVKMDGSDRLTPVVTTTSIKDEERVSVLIKNHTATVMGNITSPSPSQSDIKDVSDQITEFEIVIADKVSTEELEAERARIGTLEADNVNIRESLTATSATIDELEADNVVINDRLTANEAEIDTIKSNTITTTFLDAHYARIDDLDAINADFVNLESTYATFEETVTNKLVANEAVIDKIEASQAIIDDLKANALTVQTADIKYATIDFANIGEAAFKKIFADSGLISNLTVGDQTITGKLEGVTIHGDLIEGNTIVANKLVVKGDDGLYYKLNTDGMTVETEQTEYNSLNGSVILAKSITANKISVQDLVAFGATIGGFTITDNAISSNNKVIELINDGTFSIGGIDNKDYIYYYQDDSGEWHLDIEASFIRLGSTFLNEELSNINGYLADTMVEVAEHKESITSHDSEIQLMKDQISLKVEQTDIDKAVTEINGQIQTINQQVEMTSSSVTLLNDAISLKVEQSDIDTAIDAVEGQVTSLNTRITTNESSIDLLRDEIALKVSHDEIDNVNDQITQLDTEIKQNAYSVTQQVASLDQKIDGNTSLINQNSSSIESLSDQITLQVSTLEKSISGNTSLISQNKSSIETLNNKIALAVTSEQLSTALSPYATSSEVTLSSKELRAEFKAMGGYNFVKNSSGVNGTTLWQKSAGTLGASANDTAKQLPVRNYMSFDCGTTTSEVYAFSNRFKLKPNTKYTISFWFTSAGKTKGADIYVLSSNTHADTAGTYGVENSYDTIEESFASLTDRSWTYYTKTFTTSANAKSAYVRIDNNGYNSASTATETYNRVYWNGLIVNEGGERPWCPHPDEVYSGNTVIDATGVTIKNGALTIKNNSGNTVIKGDSNGNLVIGGGSSGSLLIKNSSNTTVGEFNANGLTISDKSFKITSAYRISDGDRQELTFEGNKIIFRTQNSQLDSGWDEVGLYSMGKGSQLYLNGTLEMKGGFITGAGSIVNGSLTATQGINVSSTSTSIINGPVKINNTLTVESVLSTANGNCNNYKVGDDSWIGDVNISDTVGIKGQQNGNAGYIKFGAGAKVGHNGSGGSPLDIIGNIWVEGTISNNQNTFYGKSYAFNSGSSSYMTGRSTGGFDFWVTSNSRIVMENGKIHYVNSSGTWTQIAGNAQ